MHVHLFNNASRRPPNEWAFALFVANGVTGVREMRTEPWEMGMVERWRTQAGRGELVAPRVLAAGVAVGGKTAKKESAPDTGTGTGNTARRQVREAKAAGADFIKIFSEVREPQWRAILGEARALGIPVCGHIPAEVGLFEAATAGQRSNEHLTQAYEACSAREKEWLDARKKVKGKELEQLRETQEREVLESFDQSVCDRTVAALAKTEQVQIPTLVLSYFEAQGFPKDFPRRSALALSARGRTGAVGTHFQRRISNRGRHARGPALGSFPPNREDVACRGGAHSGGNRCTHAAGVSRIRAAQGAGASRGSGTEPSGGVARSNDLAR
jgi:hypothetical protein